MDRQIIDFSVLVRVVLKLAGLSLVVHGLVRFFAMVPSLWQHIKSTGAPLAMLTYSGSAIVMVIIGLALWLFPKPVANTIVHQSTDAPGENNPWAAQVEIIGMSLLGMWLLYRAISDTVYNIAVHHTYGDLLEGGGEHPTFWTLMTATLVEFLFAIFLLIGAAGIVRSLRNLRTAGVVTRQD